MKDFSAADYQWFAVHPQILPCMSHTRGGGPYGGPFTAVKYGPWDPLSTGVHLQSDTSSYNQ